MSVESRDVDDETSIPKDLFDIMLKAGKVARKRGQHARDKTDQGQPVLINSDPQVTRPLASRQREAPLRPVSQSQPWAMGLWGPPASSFVSGRRSRTPLINAFEQIPAL
jgi:hypothetical protein